MENFNEMLPIDSNWKNQWQARGWLRFEKNEKSEKTKYELDAVHSSVNALIKNGIKTFLDKPQSDFKMSLQNLNTFLVCKVLRNSKHMVKFCFKKIWSSLFSKNEHQISMGTKFCPFLITYDQVDIFHQCWIPSMHLILLT